MLYFIILSQNDLIKMTNQSIYKPNSDDGDDDDDDDDEDDDDDDDNDADPAEWVMQSLRHSSSKWMLILMCKFAVSGYSEITNGGVFTRKPSSTYLAWVSRYLIDVRVCTAHQKEQFPRQLFFFPVLFMCLLFITNV